MATQLLIKIAPRFDDDAYCIVNGSLFRLKRMVFYHIWCCFMPKHRSANWSYIFAILRQRATGTCTPFWNVSLSMRIYV